MYCKCGKYLQPEDRIGYGGFHGSGSGVCPHCTGNWNLPRDEWDEMTPAERRSARRAGITPADPKPMEDVLRDFER